MAFTARRKVDLAGLQARPIRRLFHDGCADAVQPFRETLGESRRHVLGDDSRRTIGRKLLEHGNQCLDTAGGGADGDDFAAGTIIANRGRLGCDNGFRRAAR